ncbi:MAG TPA: cold shock domain-containing protein [Bacteroidales bacterium]|nr:cold shock domain-containing protein [Bacteroidales bacterium]
MGRSRETMSKRDVRIKKEKKRQEKEKKKSERKEGRDGNNLDDMIAYVDEYGNITSTPPDPSLRKAINAEDIKISVPRNENIDSEPDIREGIVTFFNNSKGFGFIKDSASKEDVFVHVNELSEPIKENDKVSFEVTRTFKGTSAINVKIIK